MLTPQIRALTLGLFWRDGHEILVFEGYHTSTRTPYYRPLGGGIHFGETGAQALIREIQEELNMTITIKQALGAIENIYTTSDPPGHELALLYEAEFCDETPYEKDEFVGYEDNGVPFRVLWKSVADFEQGDCLYPLGLLDVINFPSQEL